MAGYGQKSSRMAIAFLHNSGDGRTGRDGRLILSDAAARTLSRLLWPAGSAGAALCPAAGAGGVAPAQGSPGQRQQNCPPCRLPPRSCPRRSARAAGVLSAEFPAPGQPFDDWLMDLRSEALARGYPETVVRNLDGLQPLQRVIAADRSQAELTPGFNRYLSSRLTRLMVSRGQALARTNRTTLSRVEERFSVQREIVLAIWGSKPATGASRATRPSSGRWPRWPGNHAGRRSSAGSSSTR